MKAKPPRPGEVEHFWTGTSPDGNLRFALRRTATGLVVERSRIGVKDERAFQALSFVDQAAFGQWCDEDGMRFEYNQLCAVVRKRGVELFERSIGVAYAQRQLRFG